MTQRPNALYLNPCGTGIILTEFTVPHGRERAITFIVKILNSSPSFPRWLVAPDRDGVRRHGPREAAAVFVTREAADGEAEELRRILPAAFSCVVETLCV